MTFAEFQALNPDRKKDHLWNKGKPVGTYNLEYAKFVLYQVDAFYVEAEYKTDFHEIIMLKAFETSQLPLIYLEQLNIRGLQA